MFCLNKSYSFCNFFFFYFYTSDFTPSLGNTPKNSFSDRPPRFHNLIFHERKSSRGSSSPAPLPRRKKLGELFRDSIREEREESSEGGSSSAISTPYLSGANSGEFNDNAIEKEEKRKSNWQHHRCLPGFSSCGGSFMERRKKMSSETPVAAVKWDVGNHEIWKCFVYERVIKKRGREIQSSQSKKALVNFTEYSTFYDDKRMNQRWRDNVKRKKMRCFVDEFLDLGLWNLSFLNSIHH